MLLICEFHNYLGSQVPFALQCMYIPVIVMLMIDPIHLNN